MLNPPSQYAASGPTAGKNEGLDLEIELAGGIAGKPMGSDLPKRSNHYESKRFPSNRTVVLRKPLPTDQPKPRENVHF
jgi:hypothetical protein